MMIPEAAAPALGESPARRWPSGRAMVAVMERELLNCGNVILTD